MPAEGRAKAPDTPDNPRVGTRLKGAGQAVGIDFTGACSTTPNTLGAHSMLEYVLAKHGDTAQNELAEALFQAYFTDGICPMGVETLITLLGAVKSVAVDTEDAHKHLEASEAAGFAQVRRSAAAMSQAGIHGVPAFFINGQFAFSGAQPEQHFLEIFDALSTGC